MTLLAEALEVKFESTLDNEIFIYSFELDSSWTVAAVPQGGYSLGKIVEACIKHQSASGHMDPIHVSAHFLQAANVGRGEVHVKVMKVGKTFTNLLVKLVQQGRIKIVAHLIFGELPNGAGKLTSPYTRRLPLALHPSLSTPSVVTPTWAFQQPIRFSLDERTLARNKPDSITRTTAESIGGGGIEWAAWCELASQGDELKASAIPFFADTFPNTPFLLPPSEPSHDGDMKSWYPTITMALEFKARIPSSGEHSPSAVGIYCETRFLSEPNSRHDTRVEVWTAPSRIGEGEPAEGWRENQYCIAVGNQMSIRTPLDLNLKERKRDSPRL